MKKVCNHLILLTFAAFLVACEGQIEQNGSDLKPGASTVAFKVGSSTVTKAVSSSVKVSNSYEIDGTELELSETVELLENSIDTKGTPVYTQNVSSVYPSLAVTAYNAKTFEKWGESDIKFDYQEAGKVYSHDYSKGTPYNLSWPDEGKTDLRFFVRAPYFAADDPVSKLEYTLTSTSAAAQFYYSTPATASAQKDILFGSEQIKFENKTAGEKNIIELYHVLTGVKFKVADKTIEDKITVTKVEFAGVLAKATCNVETIADGKNSEDVVAWTADATPVKGKFSQEFSADLVTAGKNEGFDDSFYSKDTYKNNLNDDKFSLMFWFIPQNLDTVTATIYFKVNGGNEQKATVSFGLGKNWNAGEIHTYTLSPKGAGITIEDTVSGQEKSNVVITNTGNMPEYIRVAVVANWVDAKGAFVQSVDPVLTLGNNWVRHGVYYYYKNEVNPGMQPADAIFDKYTVSEEDAPAGADHMEMSLAVQAIDTQALKDYKAAWIAAGISF